MAYGRAHAVQRSTHGARRAGPITVARMKVDVPRRLRVELALSLLRLSRVELAWRFHRWDERHASRKRIRSTTERPDLQHPTADTSHSTSSPRVKQDYSTRSVGVSEPVRCAVRTHRHDFMMPAGTTVLLTPSCEASRMTSGSRNPSGSYWTRSPAALSIPTWWPLQTQFKRGTSRFELSPRPRLWRSCARGTTS